MQMSFISTKAKPFLKWAGGKTSLLNMIHENLPGKLLERSLDKYIEPFVGGGAVFFSIFNQFDLKKYNLVDINFDLVLAYNTIKTNVQDLIDHLYDIQIKYGRLSIDEQADFYYEIRKSYNLNRKSIDQDIFSKESVDRAVQFIFLNRTCFNGLFRVNEKGEFNVPFGKYKNPRICDSNNLQNISNILKDVKIIQGDYKTVVNDVNSRTFVYFDPPYRPISESSSFNSYSRQGFNDIEQMQLAEFFRELDKKGAYLMLSNSDPKNIDPKDDFFEKAYKGFNIRRIKAPRLINSRAEGRGLIDELLITNY